MGQKIPVEWNKISLYWDMGFQDYCLGDKDAHCQWVSHLGQLLPPKPYKYLLTDVSNSITQTYDNDFPLAISMLHLYAKNSSSQGHKG